MFSPKHENARKWGGEGSLICITILPWHLVKNIPGGLWGTLLVWPIVWPIDTLCLVHLGKVHLVWVVCFLWLWSTRVALCRLHVDWFDFWLDSVVEGNFIRPCGLKHYMNWHLKKQDTLYSILWKMPNIDRYIKKCTIFLRHVSKIPFITFLKWQYKKNYLSYSLIKVLFGKLNYSANKIHGSFPHRACEFTEIYMVLTYP